MKNILFAFSLFCSGAMQAQVVSNASFMTVQGKGDVQVPYRITDEGKATPIEWGFDLAWLSEDNVRRGILYSGKEIVDIMRLSFQSTASVESGKFTSSQTNALNKRINYVKKYCKSGVGYNINCDHPSLDPWYDDQSQTSAQRAERWAMLIDMTADYYKKNGLTNLVSISPFNEPDYEWHALPTFKNRKADFRAICQIFKENEAYKDKYKDVRMCGGNTLNDDQAYSWWSYMKPYIDEGNTHQLAGDFAHYASFFEQVRADGNHATNDELHNTMEAMVGVEYGMQTGIWWGTAEYTRSQFMKATYQGNPGKRLAYAEHRNNWTAASIYRHVDGSVQAFGGTSERQAKTTTFCFNAQDKPVWYAGQRGHDYVLTMPGGTGYQQGQVNAETVMDIQTGDDIMPEILEGTYKIMNVNSGKVLGFSADPGTAWTQLLQKTPSTTAKYHQMILKRLPIDLDFYYYTIAVNVAGNPKLDILNWSLSSGAQVGSYPNDSPGNNEQWFLQPAGNGAFYIRSRHSAKYLQVKNDSKVDAAEVILADFTGSDSQKWRFLPAGIRCEIVAPAVPTELTATENNNSVTLAWQAPTDKDALTYNILRSTDGEQYDLLARGVTTAAFTDNEAMPGQTYYYTVEAVDPSLNKSKRSEAVTATATGERGEVMHLTFDEQLYDATLNGNHATLVGTATYTTNDNRKSLSLNGSSNFLQLPYTVGEQKQMTVSCWVNYRSGSAAQTLWSMGDGITNYLSLMPNYNNKMQLVLSNNGINDVVQANKLDAAWKHVVVTIDEEKSIIYVDGEKVAESTDINTTKITFPRMYSYIGCPQTKAKFAKAYMDEFVIHNYALSAEEVMDLSTGIGSPVAERQSPATRYDLQGRKMTQGQQGIAISKGKKVLVTK